jgi:DNA-binding beta-propeller fold protein YncE
MIARRLVLCVVWLLYVLLGAAPAFAHSAYTSTGSFGVQGPGAGGLSDPMSVAVDQETHDVYVADTKNFRVEEFDSTGKFILMFGKDVDASTGGDVCAAASGDTCQPGTEGSAGEGQFSEPTFVAVDNACFYQSPRLSGAACEAFDPSNGDVYVADRGTSTVYKFDATGGFISANTGATTPEGLFSPPSGIAVDSSGNLWLYTTTSNMFEFDQGGAFLQSWQTFGSSPSGIGVDSAGNLYLVGGSGAVEKFTSGGARISQADYQIAINATGLTVDLATGDIYVDYGGLVEHVASCGSPGCTPATETFGASVPESQSNGGADLAVDSTTGSVYVADPELNEIVVYSPEILAHPMIEEQSAIMVTAESATFTAKIDPTGLETKYHFEYGQTSSYGKTAPIPDATVGSGFGGLEVSTHVQGLLANTVYHYRVVAQNGLGAVDGNDQTLTTQGAGLSSTLPDGREWEMVSPPDKHGALVYAIDGASGDDLQASADGSALAYLTSAPTETDVQGYAGDSQVLSTRGPNGWESRDITPAHDSATGLIYQSEYTIFSSDLSLAVVQPLGGFTPLSVEASEQTAYLHADYPSGDIDNPCATSCFRPLVTGKPGYANVPPGTVIAPNPEEFGVHICSPCGPEFVDATPDLSHILLSSYVALTSQPLPTGEATGLYEWSAGKLELISVLPDGEPATLGSLGHGDINMRNAISADGSRVVWSDGNDLFLRDTAKRETIELAGGGESGFNEPVFQFASADGSKVFFSSVGRLTENSGAGGNTEPDLYECEIVEVAAKLRCKLSDLTPAGPSGESANVQGLMLASEDGSYVYFVADGVFAPGAVLGRCRNSSELEPPSGATCNLYVLHDGTTKLIAVLSQADRLDWANGEYVPKELSARVSPDGRWLAFMSERELTGYDNRDALSGEPDEEVYIYDADSGRLVCASCDPTGARPVGAMKERGLVDEKGQWNRHWLAGELPSWTEYKTSGIGLVMPPMRLIRRRC